MAKLNGFEIKGLKNTRTDNDEMLLGGNVYYEGKKVGYVEETPGEEPPVFTIQEDYEDAWEESLRLFCDARSIAKKEEKMRVQEESDFLKELKRFVECEVFYYLVAAKEWERIYKRESKETDVTLAVFEEVNEDIGCRTGAYKLYVTSEAEKVKKLSEQFPTLNDEDEPISWIFSTFEKIEDFDIKKETL